MEVKILKKIRMARDGYVLISIIFYIPDSAWCDSAWMQFAYPFISFTRTWIVDFA